MVVVAKQFDVSGSYLARACSRLNIPRPARGYGIAIFELTEATQMRYVNGIYVRESEYVPPKSKWTQQSHWTSTHDVPCGRFLVVAYAGYYT